MLKFILLYFSATFNVPRTTLWKHALRRGILTSKKRSHLTVSNKSLNGALNALRTGALSVKKASKAFEIPCKMLYKIAKREGIKFRSFPATSSPNLEEALRDIRSGKLSVLRASKKFGIPKTKLYNICKRQGIELIRNSTDMDAMREETVKALDAIRSGQTTVQKASTEFGIPRATLYAKCKKVGIELGRGNSSPAQPLREETVKALEAIRSGRTSVQKASAEFGISTGTLYSRCRKEGITLRRGNPILWREDDMTEALQTVW